MIALCSCCISSCCIVCEIAKASCFRLLRKLPRLCSEGYAQTVRGVLTPGITLQRTSVSSVGHSYPYPELLEVLYDIHTCTRNFWKFCTPVATIPGVRVQHVLYPLGTSVSSVRLCPNTRNFWKFCKILIPLPGNSATPVRLWHTTRGTGIPSLHYPGISVFIQVKV